MKNKWIKDYCPYAKDQGFDSVIGNVAPGETVFGFRYRITATPEALTFASVTENRVTMMRDTGYRVLITKVSAGSEATIPSYYLPAKLGFTIVGENGEDYDVIVVGRVGY